MKQTDETWERQPRERASERRDGRLVFLFLFVFVSVLPALACCAYSSPARLSGKWVLIADSHGSRIGLAAPPSTGSPLGLQWPPTGCVVRESFDKTLGPECLAHESEGQAAAGMTGEVPLGPSPTPGEVRWYCGARGPVRVVIDRCNGSDTFRIREFAFELQGEAP